MGDPMDTQEFPEALPWPPERPPKNKDTKRAWAALHKEAIAHAKRKLPIDRGDARALLKVLRPKEMRVHLVTEQQHANGAFAAVVNNEIDYRPLFERDAADEGGYDDVGEDDDYDEDEQGDLAMVNVDFYSADTRFHVAMTLEWRETILPTNADDVELVEYEYRRISVHPDSAAYLISRLNPSQRKTIADALVFQLIKDDGEQLAEEEYDDGGVAPTWRNRENDPALDSLRICTHLRALYERLVAGRHPQDHMNDDPDAPSQPPGT